MLKQRILTALVMLLVLLPAAASRADWPFAAVTLLLLSAAGWEWSRLNGGTGAAPWLQGGVVALGALGMAALGWVQAAPAWLWQLVTLLWVLGGVYALRAGVAAWQHHARAVRLVLGTVMLWAAWLAVVHAHARGLNLLLSILCLVWMADIAAYFGGRAFGRRKLAPAISPGKSWAGAWSGVLGVLVLAAAWAAWDRSHAVDGPSLYTLLIDHLGLAGAALAVVFLTAMSVVGDLFESLVKRSAGAKDSSRLLPGHGGVLDRVDALLPVCPLALALAGPLLS